GGMKERGRADRQGPLEEVEPTRRQRLRSLDRGIAAVAFDGEVHREQVVGDAQHRVFGEVEMLLERAHPILDLEDERVDVGDRDAVAGARPARDRVDDADDSRRLEGPRLPFPALETDGAVDLRGGEGKPW